jgi:superfamily II DNA or RNA helicase
MDMLGKFFINDQNNCSTNRRGRFTEATRWRLKNHAHTAFWRWVTSWARAARFPSDLGFSDDGYILPELKVTDEMIKDFDRSHQGALFAIPAKGESERRQEQKATIQIRCEEAAEKANNSGDFTVVWCNLNPEGDLLEKLIPDAIQVSGKDSDDAKEEKLQAFTKGKARVLITKPKIGAWGLNWQHCNRVIYFPTHSYEQYYQAVRRCWRFGQKRPVQVDRIYTDGDVNIIDNLDRKSRQADEMFIKLVKHMNNSLSVTGKKDFTKKTEVPSWL